MSIGVGEKVCGADIVFGLEWSLKKNKCGVFLETLQGKQYGEAGPEFEGYISFAAYVASKIDNGIGVYQLESGQWALIGLAGGVLAPNSDSIVDEEFILDAIAEMSNIVPDSIYVFGDGDLDIEYEQVDISDIRGCTSVVVKQKFDVKKVVAIGVILLGMGGVFGYKQYQKIQAEEATKIAAIEAEKARIAEEKRIESNIYKQIYAFAPALYADKVSVLEGTVPQIVSGWQFTSFDFTSMEAFYKRSEAGTLKGIYKYAAKNGYKIREINETGNQVAIKFGIDISEDYPYSDSASLATYGETWVNVVSLMQDLNRKGYVTMFSTTSPEWAVSLPDLPSKYKKMYFKIKGEIWQLENLLKTVNIFGVVSGTIIYDYKTKSFSAEFAVYSKA